MPDTVLEVKNLSAYYINNGLLGKKIKKQVLFDINFKVKRAYHYLDKGHNVRITMYRKGRQTVEMADSKFAEILTKFDGYSSIEPEPKREGRRTFITFKSDGKAKKQENSSKETEKDEEKGKQEG